MDINYLGIIIATVVSFILGGLWYSPLMFGKIWMQIMECDTLSQEELKKMQKKMAPFYGLQLLLTLMTTVVLSIFITDVLNSDADTYFMTALIWAGFIVPTQIAGVVWANTKQKFWAKQIFIMISFQLVAIMLSAWILSIT
jgi:hypothetical protein